jgi:glycerol-3-phosphate dehydrogenase
LPEEIEFLLTHAGRYLTRDPTVKDIRSVFAGIRPLISTSGGGETALLSREHQVLVSKNGLVTIAGGKWTTYRKMAQDTIDRAIRYASLPPKACVTRNLKIHGFHPQMDEWGALAVYGSDAPAVQALCQESPEYSAPLHAALPVLAGEVIWAARHEMARTVEDVLSRRTRSLVQNARASIEMAPRVAALLAAELDQDENWQQQQIAAFQSLAAGYILK